jgi:hypothetical protein
MGATEAHGPMGTTRGWAWAIEMLRLDASTPEDGTATRSQDGHIVRVVGGVICM